MLALLPLAIRQAGNRSNHWIEHSSYLFRLRQVPALFLIGPETHLRVLLKFLAFAIVALSVALLIWRSRRKERQGALLPGALALAGFLITAIPGHSTLLGRNLLPICCRPRSSWPPGWAPRAPVWSASSRPWCCARIGATAVISVDTTDAFQRPNWALVADALQQWPAHGQTTRDGRIIVIQDNPGLLPLGLYLKHVHYIEQPTLTRISRDRRDRGAAAQGPRRLLLVGLAVQPDPVAARASLRDPGLQDRRTQTRARLRDPRDALIAAAHGTADRTAGAAQA